jgi:DNA-directed RNA polymerase subunit K/omega
MIVSTRARQLSEQKGQKLDGEGSERFITHAINEIETERLDIISNVSQNKDPDAARVDAQ